ncbi:hypothetical protein ACEV7Y_13775 [Vibrio parahaemolyticus]|uniref:hypothetical protein n=1 Tax=Vibrio TaxID=662 RepID=UPI0003FC376B|nr:MULTISPECIES: hypothetical protein [Vibrio]EIU6866813.1 hypothetical protein [Vibrio parahaemolyticus]MCG6432062.1 hypothetical protein [Vibrio parahaemolyticus]TNZ94425.1 hypothetical protein CGK37_07360 [Vibrio parahaemolyticus]TOA13407.1 hypothetical protein CGK34_11835 [Vibrio parahaemolyticus]TOA15491.1 hypothetical protein CGK34_07120 [Vibrio parahaemolyticus]
MKSIINQLNNYTSNLTIEDICLLSDYDYQTFFQQYKKLVYITGIRQYWLIKAKQQRNHSNIKQFKVYHKAQQHFYQQVTEQFHLRTGIDPSKAYGITELYEAMLERHSRFHIAKSIYADDLLTAIQYARCNTGLWQRFKQELTAINIRFKDVSQLLTALHYADETSYQEATDRMANGFRDFYQYQVNRDFETLVLEAMSFGQIFQHCTPCFKIYNLRLTFPEIYVIKACLSQAIATQNG